jgi:hypothetical protein
MFSVISSLDLRLKERIDIDDRFIQSRQSYHEQATVSQFEK